MPSVDLPLLDWLQVLDCQLRSGHDFIAIDHGQQSAVLICYGGRCSSVLDVGMSAELFLGAEDAVGMRYVVPGYLFSPEVGAIEAKALEPLPESVVKEGLAELHVAVHDALLEQLLKLMMVDVGLDNRMVLVRQATRRYHFLVVLQSCVDSYAPKEAPIQKPSHRFARKNDVRINLIQWIHIIQCILPTTLLLCLAFTQQFKNVQ